MVNAFDSASKTDLHGLSANDFHAWSGKASLTIVKAGPVYHNRVLVLVDGRGMASKDIRDIAQLVREQAPPAMPVALGVLRSRVAFTRGFLTDYDEFGAEIANLLVSSSAPAQLSLYGALQQAITFFGPARSGDTLLLVTSGTSTHKLRERDIARSFNRHQLRLQLLMPPPPVSVNASSLFSVWENAERFSGNLITLANHTGGALMGFMNADWVGVASAGYMLAVQFPSTMVKPAAWNVSLPGSPVKADLFYPATVTPCSQTIRASAFNPGAVRP
ncbi:MAG: hypothetical protein ACRD4F_01710 [Candidatus Angelobacter sp.]